MFSVRKGSTSGTYIQEPVRLEPGEQKKVVKNDYSLLSSNKRVIIINPVSGRSYRVDVRARIGESIADLGWVIKQNEQINDLSIRLAAFFIRTLNVNLISGQPY